MLQPSSSCLAQPRHPVHPALSCPLPAGAAPAWRAPHACGAGLLRRLCRPGGGGRPAHGAVPGADCVGTEVRRKKHASWPATHDGSQAVFGCMQLYSGGMATCQPCQSTPIFPIPAPSLPSPFPPFSSRLPPPMQGQPGGGRCPLAERRRRHPGRNLPGEGPGWRRCSGAEAPHGAAVCAAGAVGEQCPGEQEEVLAAAAPPALRCAAVLLPSPCRAMLVCSSPITRLLLLLLVDLSMPTLLSVEERSILMSAPYLSPPPPAPSRTSCMPSGWACGPASRSLKPTPTAPC